MSRAYHRTSPTRDQPQLGRRRSRATLPAFHQRRYRFDRAYTVVMRIGCALLLLLTTSAGMNAQPPRQASSDPPARLAAQMKLLGCQPREAQNVIQGKFGERKATDWAALCWGARVTTLVVFWSDPASNPAELQRTFDGDGQRLSIRRIVAVDKSFIVKRCKAPHGKLPRIDHQGILDTFSNPVVHYYQRGEWMDLSVIP